MPTFGTLGSNIVPLYGGGQVKNPANVLLLTAAPSTNAIENAVGTLAINTTSNTAYLCVKNTRSAVTWEQLGLSSGTVGSLTGDSGGAVGPSNGNISLLGTANQITVTGTPGSNKLVWSLPSALTAPGSVTSTTTLTATAGNITATAGNFVCSAAGNGLSLNITPASGATPQTQNGRSGQATFTGVSIATNSDQTFVINNSTITSATQVVLLGWSGATTGSALSVKSVTLDGTAHTITIVMTNGDGASIVTSTADITFTFLVLN